MNKLRIFMFFVLLMTAFTAFSTQAQTTVWIVRHAEKDMKNPSDKDPALSLDGQDRAKDLASLLLPQRILAVYSTPFKRTMQTVEPTAYGHGVKVQTYDPADPAALAATVLRQHKGGSVVIVGHSNTVLELVEAFGIKRPIPALNDDDYNYLFAITVQGNSTQLQMSQYGKLRPVAVPK
ncbi:MAG: histidine phosphatase family protein [Bacteroidota bacterium]